MKKSSKIFTTAVILSALLTFFTSCSNNSKTPESNPEKTPAGPTDEKTFSIEGENDISTYTEENGVITLSKEGTEDNPPKYILKGDFKGKIVAQTKGTVITLNGVNLSNENAPAIEASKKIEIKVGKETVNKITVTGEYSDDNKIGAITGEKKVELGGSGILEVSGGVCHGIKANDMEVKGTGTYTVIGTTNGSAINCNNFEVGEGKNFTLNLKNAKNGIKADKSIKILSGTFNLSNLKTGFKTDDDVETETGIEVHPITIADDAEVNFEKDVKNKYSRDLTPVEE